MVILIKTCIDYKQDKTGLGSRPQIHFQSFQQKKKAQEIESVLQKDFRNAMNDRHTANQTAKDLQKSRLTIMDLDEKNNHPRNFYWPPEPQSLGDIYVNPGHKRILQDHEKDSIFELFESKTVIEIENHFIQEIG